MISLALKAKQLEKLAIDNSPVILTAIGVVGTITTAILTHRSTVKAERLLLELEDQQLSRKEPFTPVVGREKLEMVWKHYIPPVISGSVTIGCIVMANHVGTKRAAAVAAAYTISEKAYAEYKDKVVEKLGEKKEREIREEIVHDRIRKNPPDEGNVVVIGNGEVLCNEQYSGRYFNSSIEDIKKAMNDVNYQINSQGYASLSDFYDRLGIPHTSVSDEMGWSVDKIMDIMFTYVGAEDGRPCVAITYMPEPIREHRRFR